MAVLNAMMSGGLWYPATCHWHVKLCSSSSASRFIDSSSPFLALSCSDWKQRCAPPSQRLHPGFGHLPLLSQRNTWLNQRGLAARASSTDVFDSNPVGTTDEEVPRELGAVVFKRSVVNSHYEYTTTLEHLDLASYSSDFSKRLGDAMGLGQSETGTPVSVSLDVAKERRDLRLSGMVRTALGLQCSWCLDPLAERVYAEVDLLLTAEPPPQPTSLQAGAVLDSSLQPRQFNPEDDDVEGFEELDLDLDDKLHFPPETKEIDLSTYIRDTVHLNIPIMAQCSDTCRGCCLKCGVNLNRETCGCEAEGGSQTSGGSNWGPLKDLSKKMKRRPKK